MLYGYGGSILRVNLTTGKITKTQTPAELARDFVGGRGFGAYFLFKEVPKNADPLGPENKLIISSGPLSGLMIPGGGKCDWTTKSPLTGGYARCLVGRVLHRRDEVCRAGQHHPGGHQPQAGVPVH